MQPTRARHWVVVFAVALAMISYTDRIIISEARPQVQHEFGLTDTEMGWVFTVFSLAYMLFEIPGGWMGDRWGAKRALLRVVAWWSFFVMATGWMWNYASLLVCRFLFGAGEAGCFPNLTKSTSVWLPGEERVRAQGWIWFAARWGGAATPLLVNLLLKVVPWRMVFVLFGFLGLGWVALFWWWYRDHPKDHPQVNSAELALLPAAPARLASHQRVPWEPILVNLSVWLLWWQFFFVGWAWWFYITWLPGYLRDGLGMGESQWILAPVLTGLPLFLGGIGCWFSGQVLSPWLNAFIPNKILARRALGSGAMLGAGVCLFVSLWLKDPVAAMLAMGLAGFCNDLMIPMAWGACMDMGGRYVGTVSGGMNMVGAAGGAMAGWTTPYLLKHFNHNWSVPILVLVGCYAIAAICWAILDPVTPVADGRSSTDSADLAEAPDAQDAN